MAINIYWGNIVGEVEPADEFAASASCVCGVSASLSTEIYLQSETSCIVSVSAVLPGLFNTGLILRYFLDEAASGTTPTEAKDVSGVGTPFDLPISYDTNLSYAEVSGNRGIQSANITDAGILQAAIDDSSDKVRDAIVGSKTCTLEVVVFSASDQNPDGARIFGINDNTTGVGNGPIFTSDHIDWGFRAFNLQADFFTATYDAKIVLHAVLDSSQANADDRIKIYEDGVEISSTTNSTITQDDVMALPANCTVTMLNRPSLNRAFKGTLYYAAMYSHAFTPSEVAHNAGILSVNDDRPRIEFAASATCLASGSVVLTTAIAADGDATCKVSCVASLSTAIQFATTSSGRCATAASLSTQIHIASSSSCRASVVAALSTAIQLASSPTAVCSGVGAIQTAIRCAVASSGKASGQAALLTFISLQSQPSVRASCNAALQTSIHCAAAPSVRCSTSSSFSTVISLASHATGVCSARATDPRFDVQETRSVCSTVADLLTAITCAAESVGHVSTELSFDSPLRASAECVCSTESQFDTAITASVSASGIASGQADLLTAIQLDADSSGVCSVLAGIQTAITCHVDSIAKASCSAELQTSITLQGSSSGHAEVSGSLLTAIRLVSGASCHIATEGGLDTEIACQAAPSMHVSCIASLETGIEASVSSEGHASCSGALQTSVLMAGQCGGSCSASASLSFYIPFIVIAGQATGSCSTTSNITVPFNPQTILKAVARTYVGEPVQRSYTLTATARAYALIDGGA